MKRRRELKDAHFRQNSSNLRTQGSRNLKYLIDKNAIPDLLLLSPFLFLSFLKILRFPVSHVRDIIFEILHPKQQNEIPSLCLHFQYICPLVHVSPESDNIALLRASGPDKSLTLYPTCTSRLNLLLDFMHRIEPGFHAENLRWRRWKCTIKMNSTQSTATISWNDCDVKECRKRVL